jgi:hypothetical protein
LRDPHIIFDLPDGRTSQSRAVNRQTEHVGEAVLQVDAGKQAGIGRTLYALNPHAAPVVREGLHVPEALRDRFVVFLALGALPTPPT